VEALLFATTPCWSLNSLALEFLDVLFYSCELFLQLVSVLFQSFLFLFYGYKSPEEHIASRLAAAAATSPSSRSSFASAWLTHFLSPPFYKVRQADRVISTEIRNIIKYLSYYLTTYQKNFSYFSLVLIPEILSRTFRNRLSSSFSYFLRDSKLALFNSCSLNLSTPLHLHVQTSFNIQRQFSSASSSIEYGIQYPFLSFLTRPARLNIFKCCDIAAGVMPNAAAIYLAPSGPSAFRSSIILTRVSTPNTLNISEDSNFILSGLLLIKHFNYCLNILQHNEFVKCFLKSFNSMVPADSMRTVALDEIVRLANFAQLRTKVRFYGETRQMLLHQKTRGSRFELPARSSLAYPAKTFKRPFH
jgi:hypothetical protein